MKSSQCSLIERNIPVGTYGTYLFTVPTYYDRYGTGTVPINAVHWLDFMESRDHPVFRDMTLFLAILPNFMYQFHNNLPSTK